MRSLNRVHAVLMTAVWLSLACGAANSDGPPGTFTEVYTELFPRNTQAQCTLCHGLPPNDRSNGLLSVGDNQAAAYAALVGPVSISSHCRNQTYVVPGQPDESLLYEKLTSPPCGDHMPLGGSSLTTKQLQMVRTWIAAGAQDD